MSIFVSSTNIWVFSVTQKAMLQHQVCKRRNCSYHFSDEKGVLKRRGSSIFKPFFYNHVVSDDNDIHLHERVPNLGLANFEVSYILLRV